MRYNMPLWLPCQWLKPTGYPSTKPAKGAEGMTGDYRDMVMPFPYTNQRFERL